MQPIITDRGSHVEIHIAAGALRRADFIDYLARIARQFGPKPILVECDDPEHEVSFEQAYRIGEEFARRVPLRSVAVVLRGRKSTELERITEFVAANRGASIRYFDDAPAARSWLRVH